MLPSDSDYRDLVDEIVAQIQVVKGVRAVVLGGSRARGAHTPSSDIDLGIYYDSNDPMDLRALNKAARQLDDSHRENLLTAFGGWGPRINGGGWLTIRGVPVDFLYRDLVTVKRTIDDCLAGQVEIYYQPGHPHGFVSSIYMAEIALCQPLWQSDNQISTLKTLTQPYPKVLQRALVDKFAWEISFALATAKKGISRADVAYVSGSAFRSVACMCQVLFALNKEYWLNEKGAVALVESLTLHPPDWQARVEQAFGYLTTDKTLLAKGIELLENLAQEIVELARPE